MPRLVDLRKKPYYLNDDQIVWVESTLENLTDEEKIGQLFVNLFFFGGDAFSGNNLSNQELINRYHIGGARYMNGSPEQVQGLINDLQSYSKVPLLVAANCDSGGDGAVKGGTYISSGAHLKPVVILAFHILQVLYLRGRKLHWVSMSILTHA